MENKHEIYTLTMNPAIDMNIITNSMVPNKVNRTESIHYSPNGKGLNVSFVLNHYGIESTILGFFGGFTGKHIVEEVKKIKGVDIKPVFVDGITRINIFISLKPDEYNLVNKGVFVPEDKRKELLAMISKNTDCKYISISGSLPQGITDDFYHEILALCKGKKIEIILDISSKILPELLQYRPLLIKPNDFELMDVFGYPSGNDKEVKEAMKNLSSRGAKNVLLTMGDKGLYFYNGSQLWFCDAPKIEVVSTACAGDSALAAFLSEWLYNGDEKIETALKKSSATGADVAGSVAIGELKRVDEYMKLLTVKEVL